MVPGRRASLFSVSQRKAWISYLEMGRIETEWHGDVSTGIMKEQQLGMKSVHLCPGLVCYPHWYGAHAVRAAASGGEEDADVNGGREDGYQ